MDSVSAASGAFRSSLGVFLGFLGSSWGALEPLGVHWGSLGALVGALGLFLGAQSTPGGIRAPVWD